MSAIDHALQKHGPLPAALPLSSADAFAAILVAAVSVDGELSPGESARLNGVLSTSRVLAPNRPDASPNVVERALAVLAEHGLPATLAACAKALPAGLRPTVFAQATDLVLSDGRTAPREKVFIDDLKKALQIDDALALRIVDVLLIKNRG
jgi:Tellurite resistance protein TerB